MKNFYTLVAATLLTAAASSAQVVTTTPPLVQTDTKNITITFHADQGNKGLMGLTASTPVYAHTGVITNTSANGGDWKYAPAWGDNSAKYQMTYVSANTWSLTIPSIREYYGITDPTVVVEKLAFVFRNAGGTKEGKTADNGDIFVEVAPEGFQMMFNSSMTSSLLTENTNVTFTAYTSAPADIKIYLNDESRVIGQASGVTTLTASQLFATPGDYTVYAKATSGNETITEQIAVARVNASAEAAYPGGKPRMGAVRNADGTTTFCIAAPQKSTIAIVGSWNDYKISTSSMMNKQTVDGIPYFWTTVSDLKEGVDYIYYYVVDGVRTVGDPYANLVLDQFNDKYIPESVFPNLPAYPIDYVTNVPVAVYNTNMNKYDWKVKNFKGVDQSDLIIYELLIRDFTGTEGQANGEGTIEGVMSKLDYLKDLGVNAIEFLPIMEFNGNNSWGYNTNFYMAPDKAYGTPADYRRMIDEIHRRGMAVILDIVFNQSDGWHPWYQMYDIAKNPFYNGSAPHSYSVLNDWNQDYALVQQQWYDALAFWMTEYKVDGFRFDLVKGLGNNDSYGTTYYPATNTWSTPNDNNTNKYNATRVARMKALHDSMKKINPNAYFINENLAGAQEENEMAADGEINWANINTQACQFAMGNSSNSDLNRFYAPLDSRTWGSTVSYAESHDEERMAYRVAQSGVSGVKGSIPSTTRRLGSVGAQMLLTPGAHMIWQFQEFGADQTTKNSSGNDTSPKKVIWSYLNNANRAGLLQCYTDLCYIRANNPEMFKQDVTTNVSLSAWNGRTISLVKGDTEIYLVVNPGTAEARVTAPVNLGQSKYKIVSKSYNTNPTATSAGVTLAAGAYVVYATQNVASADDVKADMPAAPAVYGAEGEIVVLGEATDVRAYNLAGTPVGLTNLRPGIYIVTVDGTATKVAVR